MSSPGSTESAVAELSSVASQLEDLNRRIVGTAEFFEAGGDEHVSHDLYEVERALRTALRRLHRAAKSAKGGA